MDFLDFMDFMDLLDFTHVFSHVQFLDLLARAESLLCTVPQLFRTMCSSCSCSGPRGGSTRRSGT